MTVPLVEMTNITKRFPGVVANDGINLEVRAGEIHALLGENGAGKSTLMNILTGLYRPDAGEIYIRGARTELHSPRDAISAGIGMVHQHFRLVQPFTVAENVILGSRGQGLLLRREKTEQQISELSDRFGLHLDPGARIWQLSVGEQQRVEIVKMLYRGADILILDEPTAVLTPQEVRELFATLRKMADSGRAVVVITHKLQEVMTLADRITVLRGGRSVATVLKSSTDEGELTRLMVDREITPVTGREPVKTGASVLELKSVSALGDKGHKALKNIALNIRAGEILGIAGVAGNGQKELAEVITGLRRAVSGQVIIGGVDMTNRGPREVIAAGVAYVPEDRLGMGLAPGLGALDNVILKDYRSPGVAGKIFINAKAARERADRLVAEFEVKTPGLNTPVKLMSGGNLQRLLLAREISARPKLIVAVYPVRGLDIGATEAVYKLLLAQRAAGAAILLISEDLDEIFNLADRVAVLYEGRVTGMLSTGEADIETIGRMMVGTVEREGDSA
jgi:simple sugar transport system ATP-binding protein